MRESIQHPILACCLLLGGIAFINPITANPFIGGDEPAKQDPAPASQKDQKKKSTDADGDDTASAGETTINLELKVSGTNAIFAAERDLSKGLTESASLKKKVKLAIKPLRDVQQEITGLEIRMLQAEQQMVGLNNQLANVNDIASNNRLVGAINSLEGQLTLAKKNLEGLKAKETAARNNLSKAREEFVQQILDLRALSDELTAAYETSAESEDVQARLKKLREETGKDLTLQASPTLQSQERKLTELEASIQTEKISLRRDGNTFYASVVINGKHTAEMVVDTGASLISLPYELAVSMGLKPEAGDKQILLTIADGSTITGHLKTADSVRVGTFSSDKVQCVVLGPEAVGAEPLLGMSFLGEFQFHLDAADGTLGLTQIEGDGPASSRKK